MNAEAYINGIFPRSNLALEAGSRWLKGRETKENFEKLLEKETIELIELQQSLGFNYATDAQLFWQDFLRPIANVLSLHAKNSSADENPVTRQIYTNTFYRKPLILNRINDFNKDIIDTKFIKIIQKGKRKVILPSPFALVYLSDGIHRDENGMINRDVFAGLLFDIAKILNNEAKKLEKDDGISFVQFNEPCMAYADETKPFWSIIDKSLNIATKELKIITSLHLYNGDVSKFLPDLLNLPVDRIGIDPYTTNLKKFSEVDFNKFLELGIVNSKNSLVEEFEIIVKYAKQVIEKINPNGLALVPNRPLELVPQHIAIKKIESLAKAVKLINKK
mgnify:CR=1 FL=1